MIRKFLVLPVLALAVAGTATPAMSVEADEITVQRYSRAYRGGEAVCPDPKNPVLRTR